MTSSILIVEDEHALARSLEKNLLGMGYRVPAIASSAEEAIQQSEEHRPHLILMDIRLKGKRDGIHTAKEILERFRIPVIFLTSFLDEDTVERAKILQPSAYLSKSCGKEELQAAIKVALCGAEFRQRQALENDIKIEELEYSNYKLSNFTYAASHDLQEPLLTILGYSEILLNEEEGDRETRKHYLSRIQKAASRMSKLVKGLAQYSHVVGQELSFSLFHCMKF